MHFTSFLWIVTSIIRNVTIHRSFYVLVTTCLRVVANSYELVTSIYESLRFFDNKYMNPANLNVSSFDNWHPNRHPNMAYERNRLQLCQQFLQLLLQIAQREEALQLPDIPRPRRRRRPARRRVWCRIWLARSTLFGQYDHFLHELNREDPASYRNFLRVDADLFGEILDRDTPAIKKESTSFRYIFVYVLPNFSSFANIWYEDTITITF